MIVSRGPAKELAEQSDYVWTECHAKVPEGGWFPLAIAAVVLCMTAIWHWGSLLRLRHSQTCSERLVEDLLHDYREHAGARCCMSSFLFSEVHMACCMLTAHARQGKVKGQHSSDEAPPQHDFVCLAERALAKGWAHGSQRGAPSAACPAWPFISARAPLACLRALCPCCALWALCTQLSSS